MRIKNTKASRQKVDFPQPSVGDKFISHDGQTAVVKNIENGQITLSKDKGEDITFGVTEWNALRTANLPISRFVPAN